ncbi:hypothetical protein Droror1_Dr00010724 [Drosera rotundifolia]
MPTITTSTSPTSSSPPPPLYYVQSPPHNPDTMAINSEHSTPVASPPRHSSYNTRHHSRDSSSSSARFSGKIKGGRNDQVDWNNQFNVLEEEEEERLLFYGEGDGGAKGWRTTWYFVVFVVAFMVLFSFFSLVLWGASQNHRPIVTMKSVEFEQFDIHAGMDYTGVATAISSLNATVMLVYQNTAGFFGVHVKSTPLEILIEDGLPIASGTIDNFYQERKSERDIMVRVAGSGIPLYGAGYTLSTQNGAPTSPLPITISLTFRSRAYILGKLVKTKFYKSINCTAIMGPNKMNTALPLSKNCTYS